MSRARRAGVTAKVAASETKTCYVRKNSAACWMAGPRYKSQKYEIFARLTRDAYTVGVVAKVVDI